MRAGVLGLPVPPARKVSSKQVQGQGQTATAALNARKVSSSSHSLLEKPSKVETVGVGHHAKCNGNQDLELVHVNQAMSSAVTRTSNSSTEGKVHGAGGAVLNFMDLLEKPSA